MSLNFVNLTDLHKFCQFSSHIRAINYTLYRNKAFNSTVCITTIYIFLDHLNYSHVILVYFLGFKYEVLHSGLVLHPGPFLLCFVLFKGCPSFLRL